MDAGRKKQLCLIVVGLIVLGSLAWQLFGGRGQQEPFGNQIHVIHSEEESDEDETLSESRSGSVDQPQLVEPLPSEKEEIIQYPVYLVGAVQRPGIYQISHSTCLYELIEEAGGFTQDAAAEHINLAARLPANQMIRIPTLAEWMDEPDAFMIHEPSQPHTNDAGPSASDPADQRININTAQSAELERLPGIGPATANSIITYRETHGSFASIEEIMNVSGIKSSRFEAIRDLITV